MHFCHLCIFCLCSNGCRPLQDMRPTELGLLSLLQDAQARGLPIGECLALWGNVEAPGGMGGARSTAVLNGAGRRGGPAAGSMCAPSRNSIA